MKKFLLLLASCVLTGTMMARQLTPDQALALAMGRLNTAQPGGAKARATGFSAASVRLTHTETTGQDVPVLYVYNIAQDGGIIIASADDRAPGLLGYTDGGDFAGAKQNKSFMAWLENCSKALSHIDAMPEQTPSAQYRTRALTTAVRPLLGEIEWDQGAPYNLLTPMREGRPSEDAELETVHAPTGCVATALAQVMMYHQWPVTGTGSHTNRNDSTQIVDFCQSTYEWSKMLPFYEGGESEESRMAVAELMRDLGCALDMDYGYAASGATDPDVLRALTDHFGYDKGMRLLYRYECSSEEWNRLLQTELNEQRPVIFSSEVTSGGGHEFVIDGYDANGLYHVNWGWGGMSNGYFDMNVMAPYDHGIGGFVGNYTIEQVMTIGVKPDEEGTSVAEPELVMTRHFLYDQEEEVWYYKINNYGLGDFTGETGLAMESPTGEVARLTSYDCKEEPLCFYEYCTYTFGEPEIPGLGYKLYPYYCDVMGGEVKRIPALYNGYCTLESFEKDGEYYWGYIAKETAGVKIDSVEVKHNFVGFSPQLNITLSNSIYSEKEYAEDILIQIYKIEGEEEIYVCQGKGQPFIKPGESQEIIVRCSDVKEEFRGKIYEGEYRYYLYLTVGRAKYQMKSGTFDMVVVPPSEITYSDFDINKTEFLPGEELVASMAVANTGGYDMKTLSFVIVKIVDKKAKVVDSTDLRDVDIEAGSDDVYTFKKVLSYEPDEYFGVFFVNGKRVEGSPAFGFVIADPSAIDKVEAAPDGDGKKALYDLQGRPVQQVRKGEMYIIGKDKFVVVE